MTVELRIPLSEELGELLVAELADAGFVAFAREGDELVAWGDRSIWTPDASSALSEWLRARSPASVARVIDHADENWNAVWEASIEPVVAGPFVVLPSWAAPAPEHAGLTVVRVDPKMSFGTGHHPSTRLAMDLLSRRVTAGATVLDVGTGTGVLAIAALHAGAARAIGCDIDTWSVPNARECAELNSLGGRFEVRLGNLDVVPEAGFDLVLANIIRSVLIPMLPALREKTVPGGSIVLAGLLATERDQVLRAAVSAGLTLLEEATEAEWWACAVGRGI